MTNNFNKKNLGKSINPFQEDFSTSTDDIKTSLTQTFQNIDTKKYHRDILGNETIENETAFELKIKQQLSDKSINKRGSLKLLSGKNMNNFRQSLKNLNIFEKSAEYITLRKLTKISKNDYEKLKNSIVDTKILSKLFDHLESVNCNFTSFECNESVGGITPLTYLVEVRFAMNKKKEKEIKEKYNILKDYICNYRTINGDGNCFYRAVIFRYFEILILNEKIDYLKNVISDIVKSFNSEELKQRNIIRGMNIKPDLTFKILILIVDLLEKNMKEKALEFLVKSFSTCKKFDYALILYFRYILYDYIKKNEDKVYLESFPIKIGNLLPSKYETNEGKFLFDSFYENYLLNFFTDAEKIIIYLTPMVLGIELNVIIYDDTEEEILQKFKFSGNSELKIKDVISLLNSNNHYEIIYNLKDHNNYKNIFSKYENNMKSIVISPDIVENESENLLGESGFNILRHSSKEIKKIEKEMAPKTMIQTKKVMYNIDNNEDINQDNNNMNDQNKKGIKINNYLGNNQNNLNNNNNTNNIQSSNKNKYNKRVQNNVNNNIIQNNPNNQINNTNINKRRNKYNITQSVNNNVQSNYNTNNIPNNIQNNNLINKNNVINNNIQNYYSNQPNNSENQIKNKSYRRKYLNQKKNDDVNNEQNPKQLNQINQKDYSNYHTNDPKPNNDNNFNPKTEIRKIQKSNIIINQQNNKNDIQSNQNYYSKNKILNQIGNQNQNIGLKRSGENPVKYNINSNQTNNYNKQIGLKTPGQNKNICMNCKKEEIKNININICKNCFKSKMIEELYSLYILYIESENKENVFNGKFEIKLKDNEKPKTLTLSQAIIEYNKNYKNENLDYNTIINELKEKVCIICTEDIHNKNYKIPCNCHFCSKDHLIAYIQTIGIKNETIICDGCNKVYSRDMVFNLGVLCKDLNIKLKDSIIRYLNDKLKKICCVCRKTSNINHNSRNLISSPNKSQKNIDIFLSELNHYFCDNCFNKINNLGINCQICKVKHYMNQI